MSVGQDSKWQWSIFLGVLIDHAQKLQKRSWAIQRSLSKILTALKWKKGHYALLLKEKVG